MMMIVIINDNIIVVCASAAQRRHHPAGLTRGTGKLHLPTRTASGLGTFLGSIIELAAILWLDAAS